MIHPIISGNKWRKLREYIQIAQFKGHKHVISFGGAYSNHLYALAFAGKELGITTTGIIRGDELTADSNIYLTQMKNWGMELIFINRADYQQKRIPEAFKSSESLIIAEGGFGDAAITGIKGIIHELGDATFDHMICPVGTGTTYLGICDSATNMIIHGILTLNNLAEIEANAISLKIPTQNLYTSYVFGKYANQPEVLVKFCEEFSHKHQLKIEPIYTGKMFYGLYDLIQKDTFKPGSRLLALHTGGVKP